MNALKNRQKRSKRERDDDKLISQTIFDTFEFTMKSVALSLHELYGCGEKRICAVLEDAIKRVDEYTERYDSECVLTAICQMGFSPRKCPICEKEFVPAPLHAYKTHNGKSGKLVCSYTCMRKAEQMKKEGIKI